MNETPIENSSLDTNEELATLRHQLNSTLMLVLAITVVVAWYFIYQFIFMLNDSQRASQAAQATRQRLEEFNRVNEPQFKAFAGQLREYGKTHPDMVPILVKYGIASNAPAATPKK